MRKRFYTVTSMLCSSLIAMLGLGSCKTHKVVMEDEPGPEIYDPQVRVVEPVEERREELKVVYGPPPVINLPDPGRETGPDGEVIYDFAEVMPQFPDGQKAMDRWIEENMRYPEEARRKGIRGTVMVSFTVTADGKTDGVAVSRPVHPLLDAEAVRLVKAMPRWEPGRHRGETVAVRYFIPIEF